MDFLVHPLTPDYWPLLEDLFQTEGPAGRCWCMYWRIGPAYRRRAAEENKASFFSLVQNGPPPGLLALAGDTALGWCQLTLRESLPWLDQSRQLKRVDSKSVWVISCFYIRKGFRRQGVATALINAALEAARSAGAEALEAYPLDADLTPSSSHTGYLTTFEKAGFRIVARHMPARPIVRIEFN